MSASKKTKRLGLFLAIFLVIATLIVAMAWKPLSISQHERAMERAWGMILVEYDGNGKIIEKNYSALENTWADLTGMPSHPWERYEYHREALVDLGHLIHKEFRFQHIQASTPAASKLWELVGKAPDLANINTEGSTDTGPFVIEVWDTPDKIAAWKKFVSKYDVPDFVERFGDGEVETEEPAAD